MKIDFLCRVCVYYSYSYYYNSTPTFDCYSD